MGHSTCQGESAFGGGPTHRQRRTCDRCDRCPSCDPSVGQLAKGYCPLCVAELKSQGYALNPASGEYVRADRWVTVPMYRYKRSSVERINFEGTVPLTPCCVSGPAGRWLGDDHRLFFCEVCLTVHKGPAPTAAPMGVPA